MTIISSIKLYYYLMEHEINESFNNIIKKLELIKSFSQNQSILIEDCTKLVAELQEKVLSNHSIDPIDYLSPGGTWDEED